MTKILLVEDDKSLREIYGVRLLAEGYDIVSAGDGEEALAMAIKERPDLIISDVMMPKISGFDMLDILRSTTETRDIKVIMMTALSSDDQRARGEQLGADRYLVKSQVGIEDVVRTVHEVMEDNTGGASATPAAPVTPSDTPAAETESVAAPAPQPTTLPQPTAPFSSPKPDNLGERVINPIESTSQEPSVASKIEDELAAAGDEAPTSEPSSTPVEPPTTPFTPTPVIPADDDTQVQEDSQQVDSTTEPVVQPTEPVTPPSVTSSAPGQLPPQPQPVAQTGSDNEQRAA